MDLNIKPHSGLNSGDKFGLKFFDGSTSVWVKSAAASDSLHQEGSAVFRIILLDFMSGLFMLDVLLTVN